MLKHDILIGRPIRASNREYIHQTLYLHVDIGFSYYLIVDFGEHLLNRWKTKWQKVMHLSIVSGTGGG